MGEYTEGIERINIELSLRNKLAMVDALEAFFTEGNLPLGKSDDAGDIPSAELLEDRVLQALALLNDPAMEECARRLGTRLQAATLDESARLGLAFELCLSRQPEMEERVILQDLLESLRGASGSDDALWQGVARTLLNLEQTITRE